MTSAPAFGFGQRFAVAGWEVFGVRLRGGRGISLAVSMRKRKGKPGAVSSGLRWPEQREPWPGHWSLTAAQVPLLLLRLSRAAPPP